MTNARGFALVFLDAECPISNRMMPELNRLYERFRERGILFWAVYPDAAQDATLIRKHAADYALQWPALRDPAHALARRANATVTPEAAVFESGGRLVYRGRINDRFAALGLERGAVTRHDLEEALEALARGGQVSPRFTRAIGCSIPRR